MATKLLAASPFMKLLLILLITLASLSLIDDELFWKSAEEYPVEDHVEETSYNNTSLHPPPIAEAITENQNEMERQVPESPDDTTSETDKQTEQQETGTTETGNILAQHIADQIDDRVSIVLNLRGEDLGQDLARIAFAKILQLDASAKHNITTKFNPIFNENARTMLSCFPNLELEENHTVRDEEFQAQKILQAEWLGDKATLLEPNVELLDDGLSFLDDKLKDPKATLGLISLPYLYADHTILVSEIRHIEALNFMMQMNESCCSESSASGETLLFLDGFHDMTPNQVLTLLGNATLVLVPARTDDDLNAYTSVVPNSRVVSTTPLLRFCLLRFASHEIIGPVQSETMQWAAIFNTKAKRRLYTTTKEALISNKSFPEGSDLRNTIAFEVIDESGRVKGSEGDDAPARDTPESNTTAKQITLLPLGTDENPVSLVIQLSGEMGNQLSKLAWGYGLKWWLDEEHSIKTKIILRHQDNSKWVGAAASVKKCFDKFRRMDFAEGNTEEFNAIRQQQDKWLGKEKSGFLSPKNYEIRMSSWILQVRQAIEAPDRPAPPENSNFTLPLLYSDIFANMCYFNDRYYEKLKDLFEFETDNPLCCKTRADPDEVIFHFRNFLTEMKRAKRLGFEEASANKTAYELLAHLHPGDKVAITSRFPDSYVVQEYVDKFKERGLIPRVITGQSALHDFCFLMSAKKEMIGMTKSTYSIWAAYLGNASSIGLYSIESSSRKARFGDSWHVKFNFTNPKLAHRYYFPPVKSEEQDAEEANAKDSS